MNPSQHAEQFQSQLANYVPQFTPQFWPVWLIIAGLLLVGMWLVLGLHALLRARGVKKSAHLPATIQRVTHSTSAI
ncbi:hypothetical protein KX281_16070, partial [Escherichia coli]|nr:hypothetical protein [Escherichia coli]